MLDVVILCGGRGTRAYPDTVELPKPLLPVGGIPILEHVMGIYARQGCRRFILATGYLGHQIAERYASPPDGIEVVCVDTGEDTETGERLRRAAAYVRGDRFFATYADGVADIDLHALLTLHLERGALATVTTVALPSQYGILESDLSGRIHDFQEKPRLPDHWINAGFFVFERAALDHWQGEVLERDVLPALASVGGLYAYRHRGFWKSMDTYKDRQELDALVRSATPPWEVQHAALATAEVTTTPSTGQVVAPGTGSVASAGAGRTETRSPATIQPDAPRAAAAVGAPSTRGRRSPTSGPAGLPGDGETCARETGDGERGVLPSEPTCRTLAAPDFMPPPERVGRRRMRLAALTAALLDTVALVAVYRLVGSIKEGFLAARLVGSDDPIFLVTVPVWLLAFMVHGLYDRRRLVAAAEEARRLFHGTAFGALGVILLTFAIDLPVARSWLAVISVLTFAFVGTARVIVRAALQLLAARGLVGTRVVVVGSNREAHAVARALDRKRWLGYCPVGLVATGADSPAQVNGFPVVGHLEDLADAVRRLEAGTVVVASTAVPTRILPDLCADLLGLGVEVRVTPGLPLVSASRITVEPLDGLPVLSVRRSHQLSRSQAVAKRVVDLIGGSVLLLLTAPIMLVLAALIRLTSRGPALFRQVRVGEGGRPFVLYKLRTMTLDAEERVVDLRDLNVAEGPLFKVPDDPRVTRLGRVLRRWGLDELPQLWNVLKGEMSLVGPRPPLPVETARYDQWVKGRLKVKPGITGLWQVSGGHLLGFEDYVRYDLFYVENWSLGLDLYVLARTVPALLFRRGIS